MELIVNNDPNLHPVWVKVLGILPKAEATTSTTPDKPPAKSGTDAAKSVLAQSAPPPRQFLDNDGWEPLLPYRPANGAPVAVRKRLGPNTCATTTVLPGDSRYPVEILAAPREGAPA